MIMLDVDSELNTNIGAYEILHPVTKSENFSVYKQEFMNFYAYDHRVVRIQKLPQMSFHHAYSTC
jgi:hypothetical protein